MFKTACLAAVMIGLCSASALACDPAVVGDVMQLTNGPRMKVVKIYSTCDKTTARMCPVTGKDPCRTLVYSEGNETKYGQWIIWHGDDQTKPPPKCDPAVGFVNGCVP